ncbi:MAG TPA: histidinol-phosphate transaminase [Candidatus Binatia bacterium]|nr:histidinol-phosphate transaminase [Candidatus Binatia bacterium]
MTDFGKLVPAYIQKLASYKPGKPRRQAELESGVRCIKLASNENPFGPSPLAMEAIRAATAEVNFYPDTAVTELTARLAEIHELEPGQILVTAGSTTFLEILARTLLGPGLNAVTSRLSFIVYPIVTRATGAQFIEARVLNDGYDLDGMLAAIDANTRVVYIANPNNPTGTVLDAKTIDRFLERLPSHVITVLDEAYHDFASYFAAERGLDYSHSLDYVRAGRPVVVLRTFSKAHGLAGLRVGYGMGPAELIGYLVRMKPAFMVSSLGEAGALAALADAEHVQRAVENNAAGESLLAPAIAEMGIRVVPTWANFLFCDVGEDARPLCRALQAEGVIVRPMSGGWGAPNAFRVTIGTPEQNQQLLAALRRVRSRLPVADHSPEDHESLPQRG